MIWVAVRLYELILWTFEATPLIYDFKLLKRLKAIFILMDLMDFTDFPRCWGLKNAVWALEPGNEYRDMSMHWEPMKVPGVICFYQNKRSLFYLTRIIAIAIAFLVF